MSHIKALLRHWGSAFFILNSSLSIIPSHAGTLSKSLNIPAQRIISLSPSATELVYSAGAGKQLVGKDSFSNYPPQAASVPNIGSTLTPNLELIASLRPDLIIVWNSGGHESPAIKQLAQLYPVLFLAPQTLQDIIKDTKQIALLTGHEQQSNPALKEAEEILNSTKSSYLKQSKMATFFLLDGSPLFTLGANRVQDDFLHYCGAFNIYENIAQPALIVSQEELVTHHPKPKLFIVTVSKEEGYEHLKKLGLTPNKNQIIALDPDVLYRPTLRLINALPNFCKRVNSLYQH